MYYVALYAYAPVSIYCWACPGVAWFILALLLLVLPVRLIQLVGAVNGHIRVYSRGGLHNKVFYVGVKYNH